MQHLPRSTSGAAWRVQPRNYLLFACHATNATAQTVQLGRFSNYWYFGGRDKQLADRPVAEKVVEAAQDAVKTVVPK